ncbi:MAG: 2-hydroxychromene-2-carboxylate isomerase [Alphaproteobacteria bacterium]|jgi:2-hydroxychromene-2-carboxylate isomerase|nr:2-hydroxychromene-2-carboxylate isomerase [Alphaproteobacteria bacterium]MDP6516127.1 2-hydroxychromene-2-carboxylate isomerase [Alphaproteobacteria bacterium]
MTKQVEFFYDFGSPTSYLAYTQLPAVAARRGAEIIWRPILLGGVFKASGNRSPIEVAAKGAYMGVDMARFAKRYGVRFAMNPYFPINTLALMRGAVAATEDGYHDAYTDAVFPAMWAELKNMGEPAIVAAVLAGAGIDAEAMMARIAEPSIKDKLKTETEAAAARGMFGAPTFFVGDQMFFGQDRLDFVEAALS